MTEKEIRISQLARKYQSHLVQRGAQLIGRERERRASQGLEPEGAMAVFKQLLEGCLLTIAYGFRETHRICVLEAHFTEPVHN